MTDFRDPRKHEKLYCFSQTPSNTSMGESWSSLLHPSSRDELLDAASAERESLVEQFVSEDFDEHRLFDLLSDGDWELRVELLAACCDFETKIETPRLVNLLLSLLNDSNDFVFLSAAQTLLICVIPPWEAPNLDSQRSEALGRLRDELS